MRSKTISLRAEAYEQLRRARRHPGESFSDVIMRARWPDAPVTAGEYLALVRKRGPLYDAAGLDALEELKAADQPGLGHG
ncbi:MAG: antitoxin VapB family protein [Gemmatimonadetes bacterium]|nr:antitoxin VapB family protein [Gemmatimonadota bacterium]